MQGQIENARKALAAIEHYSQSEVDGLVKAVAKTVFDHAQSLAQMSYEETGMGVYADKLLKNQRKSELIWLHLKDKPSVGIIARHEATGITEIARPVGVVGALTPVTNPVVTPMCNIMFALKGRNAILIAPHHLAKACSSEAVRLINQSLSKLGAPEHLVQVLDEINIAATNAMMREVDVVVATGGSAMVLAAYSSGRPAYGVGPGNVQVILDQDIDVLDAAQKIIRGRSFDNGIICSCEQSVHYPKALASKVYEAFERADGYWLKSPEAIDRLRNTLFPDGHIDKSLIGHSVEAIAQKAGLDIPKGARAILVDMAFSKTDPLRREKMFPVLSFFPYETLSAGIAEAHHNLMMEGAGHSCVVYSNSTAVVETVALALPVSRVIVNQCSPLAAGGGMTNHLPPTTTLGCGSWGHNSLSENLDYRHLLNIQRIAFPVNRSFPDEASIWL